MKSLSLLLTILCIQSISFAVYAQSSTSKASSKSSSKSSLSVRDQALTENIVSAEDQKKTSAASEAQVGSGMLSLKDPRPEVITRSWKYFLQLSLQEFHPEGTAENSIHTDFNLSNNGTTAMPAVAFGFAVPFSTNENLTASFGLAAKLGYSSQTTQFTYASGFTESDVRLNTMMMAVKPYLGFRPTRLSWLEADLGVEYGTLSYLQTSGDEIANFSEHANYGGWNLGLFFEISPSLAITTEYSEKKILNSSESIAVQKNNFELGTRISW